MIFFIGLVLLIVSCFASAVMTKMGLFQSGVERKSDWIPIIPFVFGIGCVLWSVGVLCARYLP